MVSSSSTAVFACALLAACAGAPDKDGKKLRNVIITSFGELPYEPMEGFYQSDVIPVNFEDEIKQETMDVALRTGILVEDPNEKKDSKNTSEEDVETTNVKRQVSNKNARRLPDSDDEFLTTPKKPRRQKNYPQQNSDQYPLQPQSFVYDFRQAKSYPRRPNIDEYGYNINTEYYADLGEGWNLQDADEILQGRNYNILVQNPRSYGEYPSPPAKEVPPPFIPQQPRHPFYPYPGFQFKTNPHPGFHPYRGPVGFSEDKTAARGRSLSRQDEPREGLVPFAANVFYNEEFLSGA